MTITKKLFFITILCSILGSFTTNCTVNSWQLHDQNIFDFAMTLSKQENNDAKEIARWLTARVALNARGDNNFNVHTINLIINYPLTLGEKIEQLKQIEPSFIRKARTLSLFGINTALSICEGLSMAAKAAAIMA